MILVGWKAWDVEWEDETQLNGRLTNAWVLVDESMDWHAICLGKCFWLVTSSCWVHRAAASAPNQRIVPQAIPCSDAVPSENRNFMLKCEGNFIFLLKRLY
jgi:hypothetical protein